MNNSLHKKRMDIIRRGLSKETKEKINKWKNQMTNNKKWLTSLDGSGKMPEKTVHDKDSFMIVEI